ncbi:MAG: hypothetical protein FWH36_01225 [Lentimicrobiaceae bacterium]|nr:hypothetical protein [Lentimicrobiaceae bacterium]
MNKKQFEVKIFYSGYCSYEIEADNEAEAIVKARSLPINNNEFLSTIEGWEEADTAEEIIHGKN